MSDTVQLLRVLVVDDHPLVRAGIRAELDNYPSQVTICGEADSVDTAIESARDLTPDVILLDVHLPGGRGGGGVEVARTLMSEGSYRILALSVSDAADDVVAIIRAGARGYVTKTIATVELVDAIGRVGAGDAAFSRRLAGFVLDAFGSTTLSEDDDELNLLTQREREVMRLIARGYTYKEVAKELFLSVKTIETHVSRVLRKLQLSNRHELTRWASDRRLL